MKRFACFCLCLALLLPTLLLSVQAEEPTAQPYSAGTGLTTATRSHSYDDCVVDGGIYYLRNVYTGQYLDVDNAASADWTQVSTYTFHGGANQQFKFIYMGRGLYEIIPMHAGTRLHIYSDHELVIHAQNRNTEQKFRLQMVGNGVGVIYSQHGNFTRTLTWDQSNPNSVANKIYADLADKTQAQWVFERVNPDTCDSYAAFYIRNVAKNLYLDVHNEETVAGMVVHGYSFLAQANQEWKLVSYSDGGCCLQTSLQRDMALDYRGGHLTIHPDNNPSTQRFYISFEGFEEGTGRSLYRIGMEINGGMQYLTMRSQPDYATVHYYVEWSADATDLWAFEPVIVDAKDPRMLTLNTAASSSITAGYNELKYYTYRPTVTARYKVEIETSNCFLEPVIVNTVNWNELDSHTENGKTILNVILYANALYYFPFRFSGSAGGANGTYSFRIRQLTFMGHSRDDTDGNDMSRDINYIEDTLEEDMYFFFEHRRDMTKQQAQSGVCSITGYSDFNAEIFVYAGHGSGGYACYEGSDEDSYLSSKELPDMSNCELVVWDCCCSALNNEKELFWRVPSLVESSIEKGATTAIGWTSDIRQECSSRFVGFLFLWISRGATILDACRYAICENQHFSVGEIYDDARNIVANLVIQGNEDLIINPVGVSLDGFPSCEHSDHTDLALYLNANYALTAQNDSLGAEIYTKMVEGIPTDDYIIVFYDENGEVEDIHKSDYTMSDEDMEAAQALLAQAVQNDATNANSRSMEESAMENYRFTYVDGELRLVEERTVYGNSNSCCAQIELYDVLTGEVLS